MADYLGMSIEIGGPVSKTLLPELMRVIHGDFDNLTGPDLNELLTLKEGNPKWDGTGNYGLCNSVTSFLAKHDIPYIHKSDSGSEYDAEITYWLPGMKKTETIKGNNDLEPVIRIDKVKPVTTFLLDLYVMGEAALPLHLQNPNPSVKRLVTKHLKRFSKFFLIRDLQKILKELLPGIPLLPPFILKD